MKLSFIFTLLLLPNFLYLAQGIRFEKLKISAGNHEELITKNSSSNEEDGSATVSKLSSGINRKLMTKTLSSNPPSTSSENYKNVPRSDVKFTHGQIRKEEIFPKVVSVNSEHGETEDVTDITGMDYSPAKRKPPIHN